MNTLKTQLSTPLVKHILFWLSIFLYFVLTTNMEYYGGGYMQVLEIYIIIVGIQIITAYTFLNILVPKFLNTKKTTQFVFSSLLLLISSFTLYVTVKVYYFDPKYFEFYSEQTQKYASQSYIDRLLDFQVFLSKAIKFSTPAALLLMARFYKNQQKLLQLNEQKKTAELSALKHQLNPHFLFNTLNNLYALSLKKADETPEAISKLSDILDYMLYRCNEQFVSLYKEVELIENYLTLEQIRYSKRVAVTFKNEVTTDVKIAPLLLLTFIENAFKHGVSEELKQAKIAISLKVDDAKIFFTIFNTIPKTAAYTSNGDAAIGLKNVKKQLELLYPNSHILDIDKTTDSYTVNLIVKAK